jgi:hypothetical protein
MATRALIGYLDYTTNTITTTYNHYDGYPSNLGVALEKFYNSEEKAKEISNVGYISFLSSDTGEWDAVNKQAPHVIELDSDPSIAIQQLHRLIDECWANYAYIWNTKDNKWITLTC